MFQNEPTGKNKNPLFAVWQDSKLPKQKKLPFNRVVRSSEQKCFIVISLSLEVFIVAKQAFTKDL